MVETTFLLHFWGDYACFTRPEAKVERVSYPVPTPSAMRGILEAIYWDNGIEWEVDKIWVRKPIRYTNIRRNEVNEVHKYEKFMNALKKAREEGTPLPFIDFQKNRTQRAAMLLKDVDYYVKARLCVTERYKDYEEKSYVPRKIVRNRLRRGACYHSPYFGCREFPVNFERVEGEENIPECPKELMGEKCLDWMFWDWDYTDVDYIMRKKAEGKAQTEDYPKPKPIFFEAWMRDGRIDVPRKEVLL